MRGRSVPRRGRHNGVPAGTTPIRDARATPIAAGASFIRPLIGRRGGPWHRGCRVLRVALVRPPARGVVFLRRDPVGGAIWTHPLGFPLTNYMDSPLRMRRYMDTRMFFPYSIAGAFGGLAKVTLRHFRGSDDERESHSPTLSPSDDERESHSPTLSRVGRQARKSLSDTFEERARPFFHSKTDARRIRETS